ncbi:unnamed protein product [Heterobilharzia americana]|nr:unnamed protein product [Heterobilharzia americana]
MIIYCFCIATYRSVNYLLDLHISVASYFFGFIWCANIRDCRALVGLQLACEQTSMCYVRSIVIVFPHYLEML